MKPSRKTQIKIVSVAFIIILVYNHFFFNPFAEPAVIITKLNDLQQETLSNLKEMTKLLISLSTALFGLVGYFAIESFKSKKTVDEKIRMDLILAFGLAALSIDFGYISMEKWVEMLSLGLFEPYDNLVRLPQRLQLLTFLLSLLFAGNLVSKMLFNTPKNIKK